MSVKEVRVGADIGKLGIDRKKNHLLRVAEALPSGFWDGPESRLTIRKDCGSECDETEKKNDAEPLFHETFASRLIFY
jgi:hypothetical protein